MKTLLAAIAALLLIAPQAAAQERSAALAGLTQNEWQGCGYIRLAKGQLSGVEPWQCAEIKARLNGNWNLCYSSVLLAHQRRTNSNEMPPDHVRSLGMFGCSMLVNDTPEATARDAAMKAIK